MAQARVRQEQTASLLATVPAPHVLTHRTVLKEAAAQCIIPGHSALLVSVSNHLPPLGCDCCKADSSTANAATARYYVAGPYCVKCNDSKLTPALIAIGVFTALLKLFWRLTRITDTDPVSGKSKTKKLSTTAANQQSATMAQVGASQTKLVSTQLYALVASISWPHLSFSLLPVSAALILY